MSETDDAIMDGEICKNCGKFLDRAYGRPTACLDCGGIAGLAPVDEPDNEPDLDDEDFVEDSLDDDDDDFFDSLDD